jgi:membrane protein
MAGLLKDTVAAWREDKAPRLGAALAYYTVFSLAPLLLIIVAIAGLAFGRQAAQGSLDDQIAGLIGREGADLVQTLIANAGQPRAGILATVAGGVAVLFGALGAFGQLQDALNTIWEVAPRPGRGLRGLLRDRLAPAILTLGAGFLLLASLAVSAGLAAAGAYLAGSLAGYRWLAEVANFLVSLALTTVLFAMIFKVLPDATIAWRDVWLGAALTGLLFNMGKLLIGFYLGSRSLASAYGAAGSLVVLLLWVYYSSQILFFGAEFTQVYANKYGSGIRPAPHAVGLTAMTRADRGLPRRAAAPAAGVQLNAVMSRASGEAGLQPMPIRPPATRRGHLRALIGFVAGVGAGILASRPSLRHRSGEHRGPSASC